MTKNISTKSSYPPKIFIFLKTPKNIEIQNFEPPKIGRGYVCVKISEYTPGPLANSAEPKYCAFISGGWIVSLYMCLIYFFPQFFILVEHKMRIGLIFAKKGVLFLRKGLLLRLKLFIRIMFDIRYYKN